VASESWTSVTPDAPCPICGKPDWCSVKKDGTAAICRRGDGDGGGTYRVDSAGVGYWYHRLDGRPPSAGVQPGGSQAADGAVLDLVYGRLLQMLSLDEKHARSLRKRGFGDTEIESGCYRSLPRGGRKEIAQTLAEEFGPETLRCVPGFYRERDGGWSLSGSAGLIVPVRDLEERIVALKVRADREGNGPRYSYLSSRGHGGPGPGAPVHVPLAAREADHHTIRLTEGELKADVATALSGMPTISVPGVSSWPRALPVLQRLGAQRVHLAFDADAATNKVVARALSEASRALEDAGFEVALERWPMQKAKGIDDLLCSGHSPTLLEGAEARSEIARMVARTGGLSTACHGSVVSARELLGKTFPEPRWAVEGILPEGLTILGGKPKMGKSWLMLGIALGVASGGRVLGERAAAQGDVLYLALEDNERRLQSRLRKLSGDTAPEGLGFATRWPRLGDGGLEQIEAWLWSHPNARLVVIDTLARIRPRNGGNGNVYAEDYGAVEPLAELAAKNNVSIVIVHHLRKMAASDPLDQISGSLGLAGGVDGALVLKRERGRADASLYVTGRDIEEEKEYALIWDASRALWRIAGEAEEYRTSEERRQIIECLHSLGHPASPKEVAEALGKKANTIKQLLWRMARDGQVRSLGNGSYTPITANPANPDNPGDDAGRPAEDREEENPGQGAVTAVSGVSGYRSDGDAGESPYTLIDTAERLEEAIRQIEDANLVAVDLETTGLDPRKDRIRLISLSTSGGTWLIDCFRADPSPLLAILKDKKLIFHNALFDLSFLRPLGFEPGGEGEIIDTMLISQMLGATDDSYSKEAA